MSGDTPTDTTVEAEDEAALALVATAHSLDCPDCGSEVFIRAVPLWYTDEDEHCPGCGSRVMVALDEDDAKPDLLTARVYVYEHGGEVVARLRAEVGRLTAELTVARWDLEPDGPAPGGPAAFIGTLSSDETDEEFIALATALDGTPGGDQ